MNEQLQALIKELEARPSMLATEFAAALQSAIEAGETISDPLAGDRTGNSFLHTLANIAPGRADLFLATASADPTADLNALNDYRLTFADLLASNKAHETLMELCNNDVGIQIDSPVNRASRHETPYRMALMEGPYALVSAMHDYAARMSDRGAEVGKIYPARQGRSGYNALHHLAMGSNAEEHAFSVYMDELADALGFSAEAIQELTNTRSTAGQTFFNQLIDRDPDLALQVYRDLYKSVSPEFFDADAALRGDAHVSIQFRQFNLPEDSIPALQLARAKGEGAEQLMNEIVREVNTRYLQVRSVAGDTPISIMARKGWVDALGVALERGVDPNYGVSGMTANPLQEAMRNTARPDLAYIAVKKLLDSDIDSAWLKEPTANSPSVLKFAVDHGDNRLVRKALIKGADPDGHPAANYSPLRSAIEHYEKDPEAYGAILRNLVFNGASLKKLDADMLSPATRLAQPEMAAARDFVYRLSVVNAMTDRYGFDYAAAAVGGFKRPLADRDGVSAALGTLQLIPGLNRALVNLVEHEHGGLDELHAVLRINTQADPEIPAMDLVDHSRTLLTIPETNRERICLEIAKLRGAMTALTPNQLSPEAIDSYQNQIMAANRLYSWVNDSIGMEDTPRSAAVLSAKHGRHLNRSVSHFSDAIAASPLTLSPKLNEFPLSLSTDGHWKAEVSLAGTSHRAPDSGSPASFLFAQRSDGTSTPLVKPFNPDIEIDVLTYMPSIEGIGSQSSVKTGLVQFERACVIFADDPMNKQFPTNCDLLVEMGYDGAIIYDLKNSRVAGAIDFDSAARFEIPAGVVVTPDESSPVVELGRTQDRDSEVTTKPAADKSRGFGM